MFFKRISPPEDLNDLIECYWVAENNDPTPTEEKIIPDGFPEIIFHYGDPYLIQLKGQWDVQSKTLFAGQITGHFYLKNSGISGVLGIKLRPTAPTRLYGLPAEKYTDKVVDLAKVHQLTNDFLNDLDVLQGYGEMVSRLNHYFRNLPLIAGERSIDKAVEMIFKSNGIISINELCSSVYVSERQLERLFKQYVGLSPKFYCRIVRFNYIFQCIQKDDFTWIDIVHRAGFYDQSHFIRNFRNFTGEEPSSYLFEKNTLANFFLKKRSN